MSNAPVAGNVHKAFDAELHIGAQLPLYPVFFLDDARYGLHLIVGPLLYPNAVVNFRLLQNVASGGGTDALDVCQSYEPTLVSGQIYS